MFIGCTVARDVAAYVDILRQHMRCSPAVRTQVQAIDGSTDVMVLSGGWGMPTLVEGVIILPTWAFESPQAMARALQWAITQRRPHRVARA